MINNCPVCEKTSFSQIFENNKLPIYNLQKHTSLESALAAKSAKVKFIRCINCGFVFNSLFFQNDYDVDYESGRSNSKKFEKYLTSVASKIIDLTKSNISTVLEVGAGSCDFANIFHSSTEIEYIAFDTSWRKSDMPEIPGIKTVHGLYDNQSNHQPDLLVLRHVLEHQSNVKEFISNISHENPEYIFIEIPCYEFVSRKNYHFFSYEHCSYFSKHSLKLLMSKFGYENIFFKYVFNDENIISVFRKNKKFAYEEKKNSIYEMQTSNKNSFKTFYKDLRKLFNKKSILWGGSGKGVMLLNILNIQKDKMKYIIDINPKKWWDYVPVTGQKILPPERIIDIKPEIILNPNSLYNSEIKDRLNQINYSCEVIDIFK